MLPKLLRAAREILACPRACDRACHACLLTFDTQHKLDRLDRNKALQALSQDILAALDLPPELHVFGDGENRYELEPLPVALAREFQRTGATDIQIFLDGDAERG